MVIDTARPRKLKNPKTISIVVETEEYEKLIHDLPENKVAEYFRELMQNKVLKNTTDIIRHLRDENDLKEKKIKELEDIVLNIQNSINKTIDNEAEIKAPRLMGITLSQIVDCPKCRTQNLVAKGGSGRKCRTCGTVLKAE